MYCIHFQALKTEGDFIWYFPGKKKCILWPERMWYPRFQDTFYWFMWGHYVISHVAGYVLLACLTYKTLWTVTLSVRC